MENGSQVRLAHSLNAWLCSLGGVSLNLLLIWLVLKRSSREMRVYSRILLQTCFTDLAFVLVTLITQPIFIIDGEEAVGLLNGPLRNAPTPVNFIGFTLWLFNFYYSVFGICVQFCYRYLTVCRDVPVSGRLHMAILAVASTVDVLLFVYFYFVAYPPEGKQLLTAPQHVALLESSSTSNTTNGTTKALQKSFHIDIQKLSWKLWCMLLIMTIFCCYAIIFWCTARTIGHLRRHLVQHRQSKLGAVNRQLSITLIGQALLPACACVIPLFCVANALIATRTSRSALLMQALCTLPEGWLPVLNPMVAMLAVTPYRRTVFRFRKRRVNPSGGSRAIIYTRQMAPRMVYWSSSSGNQDQEVSANGTIEIAPAAIPIVYKLGTEPETAGGIKWRNVTP